MHSSCIINISNYIATLWNVIIFRNRNRLTTFSKFAWITDCAICCFKDLANPGSNKKTAGFTKEERDGFTKLLSEGFVDTFREFYPDKKNAYSFWTYMRNARAKNVGWWVVWAYKKDFRLDMFYAFKLKYR